MNQPHHPITIFVDNEPITLPDYPISVRDLLILVGLDPDNFYLIEIEGREQKSHRNCHDHKLHPHPHLKCVTARIEAVCHVS